MASGNVIVTKTVNRTTFEVDKGSYARAVKQIKRVGKEWEKATEVASKPKNSPAAAYSKSAKEMQLVNKRLAETRRREEKRAMDYSIALAKKEAKAKEAIQKVSNARIRQQVQSMTSKNPGMAEMRKFYQQQEREARRASRKMATPTPKIKRILDIQLPARSAVGGGMVGTAGPYSPATVAKQNAEMARHHKINNPVPSPKELADQSRAARRAAAEAARRDDVMAQQQIRLSSKYGRGYGSTLGRNGAGNGIEDLNKQFRAGTLSAGQYRQSIQALERQFRSAQGGAATFGSVLEQVRSGLVGVGAAYGVFNAGKSIIEQGQFFQGLDATMLMVSDNSEEAGKRMQFVRDQSYRLGLSLKEASQGYVQMAIAADGVMTKGQTDDLFKAFSEYSTALQVDPVKYQRGITALQQMMGKGQIMAEELKGQLAEGIPGSLQVFVKATQEAFGDSSIGIEKLMDLMQKGELKSAKIMPLIAKYYAEAANKGGALDKALDGNRVAMQRLQQSWMNFQNAIFEGGFGEQMTRIFRDLATILSSNGELATNLGHFFGQIMEGFWDMVTEVHDDFILLDRIFSYYAQKLGIQGDIMKEIFNWAGYAIGIGIFVTGLGKIFGILSKIAGLRGALVAIRGAMGADLGAAAAAGAAGAMTTGGSGGMGPNSGPSSPWRKNGGGGSRFKLPRTIPGPLQFMMITAGLDWMLDDDTNSRQSSINNTMNPLQSTQNPLSQAAGGDMGLLLKSALFSLWGSKDTPAATVDPNGMASSAVNRTNPFPYPLNNQPQQVEGKVTLEIKGGELRNIIKAVVDENNLFNMNMLIQGGPN